MTKVPKARTYWYQGGTGGVLTSGGTGGFVGWYRVGVGGAVTECVCDGTEFLEGTRLKVQGGLELFNC